MLNKLRIIKQVLLSKPVEEDKSPLFDCPVCSAEQVKMHPLPVYYLAQWQKYQTVHNPFFIETMHIEHYMCSVCGAPDRDRLYALYLETYFKQADKKTTLLDIAPAHALRQYLKNKPNVIYRSMDLMMEDVDDNLDITDMNLYSDEQFDLFICSHVLEHIPDDIKAMQELHRVLKKGGKGIVMVPINLALKEMIEDIRCTDTAKRWKYFFQDDHVRMYAKEDFIHRLTSAGFKVEQWGVDHFSKEVFKRNAIYPTSVLYIVSK